MQPSGGGRVGAHVVRDAVAAAVLHGGPKRSSSTAPQRTVRPRHPPAAAAGTSGRQTAALDDRRPARQAAANQQWRRLDKMADRTSAGPSRRFCAAVKKNTAVLGITVARPLHDCK